MSAEDAVTHAQRIADEILFPRAEVTDGADRVPEDNLVALADAGLFGIAGPRSHGGLGLSFPEVRRVLAAVASGCGATFFTWAQHHTLVLQLATSDNEELREACLADLCAGRTMSGVVFAHLRREDAPLTATRVDGGWSFTGFAPWATSWGIADVFIVVAESSDGEAVWGVVDGTEQPGLRPRPLELPVLMATRTAALDFIDLFVPDERVVTIESASEWRAADRVRSAIGGSHIHGLADRAIRLLHESARTSDDPAGTAAARLRGELDALWKRDDEVLAALFGGDVSVEEASDYRAACLDLGRRTTSALLASVGGRGMALDHPAQRLAREADFYVIQAQTIDGRNAVLRSA